MKSIIDLPFIERLKSNLATKSGLIQVILGPRQVGKTTTILKYLDALQTPSHYVSADAVFNATPTWLIENWQLAERERKLLVIDEIQKCQNWSETIKKLWDDSKKRRVESRCVLLGSSSLQIHKGLTDSLTGRFQLIQAFHWNYRESKDGYGLTFDQYLKFGGYPGSYHLLNTPDWSNYLKNSILLTVIERDILQYHNVKSPSLFKQAFEILMNYPAQEISYTKLLGQLQERGNVELVKYYLSLYEGAFLVKPLEKFSNRALSRKSSSPKILLGAPCLYYLTLLEDYTAEERGRAFESLVGNQLQRTGLDLYYWREGNHEVDFVLRQGKKIWAIEVKSGRKKGSAGLLSFCEQFKNARPVVITQENYFEFEKAPLEFLQSLSA